MVFSQFLTASSTKIFLTAILAVLSAGWISEALRAWGLYNSPPLLMLLAAGIMIIGLHIWNR